MMERLEPFVGEWRVETSLGDVRAVTTFEWTLGGAFLLQRSEIDLAEAPDALCLIGAAGEDFTQHYFDSRGVVRTYAMTFDGRTWTLTREEPEITPQTWLQRFVGELSGERIVGRWEKTERGETEFTLDFELTYTRA
jgi:hypothetical protein